MINRAELFQRFPALINRYFKKYSLIRPIPAPCSQIISLHHLFIILFSNTCKCVWNLEILIILDLCYFRCRTFQLVLYTKSIQERVNLLRYHTGPNYITCRNIKLAQVDWTTLLLGVHGKLVLLPNYNSPRKPNALSPVCTYFLSHLFWSKNKCQL